MKYFFLFTLIISFNSISQVGTGQWRLHIPNRNCLDVVGLNGIIYAAYQDGILEFDIEASEKSTWDIVNSLSDIRLTCLFASKNDNSIFVGYANGNIDKIKDNKVTNIPAVKIAQILGSKKINKITEYQNFIYVSTDFGILKIDPKKNEVRETLYTSLNNDAVLDVSFKNDSIFALTSTKLYKANVNNNALGDYAQWEIDTRLPILTLHSYSDIENVNNELYVAFSHSEYKKDSIFKITDFGIENITSSNEFEINSLANHDGKLALNLTEGIYIYNTDLSTYLIGYQYNFESFVLAQNSVYMNNSIWIADGYSGLIKFNDNWNNEQIYLEGPPKNTFYAMDCLNEKLVVASGGLNSISMTYNDAGIYTFKDEKWAVKDKGNMNLWKDKYIWDFLDVAINPTKPEEIAVATYSRYPLSILSEGDQVTDTFNFHNSIIQQVSIGNLSSFISNLEYDSKGNLWLFNGYSTNPLIVYSKDKTWKSFSLGSIGMNKFTNLLKIDNNDVKWLSIDGVGLIAYSDNGTITDQSDDKIKILNDGENSGALPSKNVTAIAADLNNNIWIGTDNGFAILYNSPNVFDASTGNYNAQRIKLEFEGNVEYLLGNTYITDIEVDGGNRKWLGTSNTGIFLMSDDGLEIVAQYTVENSPLISNTIIDLQFNHSTGELFIITDKGLISFRTDASEGTNDYSNVTVFPNPAKPDFNGVITIQGIKADSDVKITDVSGNLVYKTISNGGTATWNGKTVDGERVKSGVYLIWTASNEGKGRKVGKVVVIN